MFMKNLLNFVCTCCMSLVLVCCVKPAQDCKADLQELDSDCPSCINTPVLIEIDNVLYQLKVDTANNLKTIVHPVSASKHRKSLSAIKINDISFFVDSALASNNGLKIEGITVRTCKNEVVIDSLKMAEKDGTRIAIYGLNKINISCSASSNNNPDTQQNFSIEIKAIEQK